MKLNVLRLLLALTCSDAVFGGGRAAAQASAKPPDYARQSNWVCRPGDETACTTGLDAVALSASGARTFQKFKPVQNPRIDCFYVYPTVSQETGAYSDLSLRPEIADVTRSQAGRLTSRCRLFAPIYRQLTEAGLSAVLAAHGTPDWSRPYADVRAAWRWYIAHDNGGRGVVLIGHSQGAILLQRLLADQIDGQPDQLRLVAAFLAGDPALPVPAHASAGGLLKHIPVCTEASQTGCVYAWGSYLANDTAPDRMFGHNPPGPLLAGCANPAAPGGGAGELKPYFYTTHLGVEGGPAWVTALGQLAAQCVADNQGNVLRVTILPTRFTNDLRDILREGAAGDPEGWGLHSMDLDLTQGNVLDRIDQETQAWLSTHGDRGQ